MLMIVYFLVMNDKRCNYHSCNTRNNGLLRFPFAKLSKYQGSFRYNGTKAWNNLAHELRKKPGNNFIA